jgi:hypothetical protein
MLFEELVWSCDENTSKAQHSGSREYLDCASNCAKRFSYDMASTLSLQPYLHILPCAFVFDLVRDVLA